MANIQSIYRYPVKGLTPELLARTVLTPGQTVPGDRLYAIENGPSGFDLAAPSYLSKTHFLMLMKNERLANLRASFDQDSHTLTITLPSPDRSSDGTATGDLRTTDGRTRLKTSLPLIAPANCAGRPKFSTPKATASPTSRGRSSRLSISPRLPRSRPWSVRPSTPYAFAATFMSKAGRPGANLTSSAVLASAAPDSRSSSASSAAPPPMSIPTPGHATSIFLKR